MLSFSNKTLAILIAASFFGVTAYLNADDTIAAVEPSTDFAAIEDKDEGVVNASNVLIAGDDNGDDDDSERNVASVEKDDNGEEEEKDGGNDEEEGKASFDENEHVFNLESDDGDDEF